MSPRCPDGGWIRAGAHLRRSGMSILAASLLIFPLRLGASVPTISHPSSPSTPVDGRRVAQQDDLGRGSPGRMLRTATTLAGRGELDRASTILEAALERWPDRADLLEGLASLRLRQGRHADAQALATRLTLADPDSPRGWELLAASRYLQDDRRGALRAWSRARAPRVGSVEVHVLAADGPRASGTPVDPARLTGIPEGRPLTPEALVRGERRLGALPAGSRTRLGYRARPDGDVSVEGTVVLGTNNPFTRSAVAAHVLRALVGRVNLVSSDPLGRLERWELSGRIEGSLRSASLSVAHPAPMPSGVWRWTVDHATGRYASFGEGGTAPPAAATHTRTRTGVAWSHSDWATASLHGSVLGRIDLRPDLGTYAGAGVGWTWLSPTGGTSLRLQGTGWTRIAGAPSETSRSGAGVSSDVGQPPAGRFGRLAIEVSRHPAAASAFGAPSGVFLRGGIVTVSRGTPADLRPRIGAGGQAALPMRARSDLDDEGVVRTLFPGRTWAHGGVEVLRPLGSVGPVGLGAAVFADAVQVLGRSLESSDPAARRGGLHLGAGVRIRIPLIEGWLRADWAVDPADGSTALSAAWVRGAPR